MLLIQTRLLFFFSLGVLRVIYSTHVVYSELKSKCVFDMIKRLACYLHAFVHYDPTKKSQREIGDAIWENFLAVETSSSW